MCVGGGVERLSKCIQWGKWFALGGLTVLGVGGDAVCFGVLL